MEWWTAVWEADAQPILLRLAVSTMSWFILVIIVGVMHLQEAKDTCNLRNDKVGSTESRRFETFQSWLHWMSWNADKFMVLNPVRLHLLCNWFRFDIDYGCAQDSLLSQISVKTTSMLPTWYNRAHIWSGENIWKDVRTSVICYLFKTAMLMMVRVYNQSSVNRLTLSRLSLVACAQGLSASLTDFNDDCVA